VQASRRRAQEAPGLPYVTRRVARRHDADQRPRERLLNDEDEARRVRDQRSPVVLSQSGTTTTRERARRRSAGERRAKRRKKRKRKNKKNEERRAERRPSRRRAGRAGARGRRVGRWRAALGCAVGRWRAALGCAKALGCVIHFGNPPPLVRHGLRAPPRAREAKNSARARSRAFETRQSTRVIVCVALPRCGSIFSRPSIFRARRECLAPSAKPPERNSQPRGHVEPKRSRALAIDRSSERSKPSERSNTNRSAR
jgi:hypothetical protein